MSDLSQGIASLIAPSVQFTSDTRLYDIDTPLGEGALTVERFASREALSTLYELHVDCLSTDTHIELKQLLGEQAALRIRLPDGSLGTRSGYVSAVAQLGADGGLARYRLTLVPWLTLATQQRRSRVFQEISLLDLLTEVLSVYSPNHNWRITPDAETLLAELRPRSYCCQYRESDYDFLLRILTEEGIGFYFEESDDDNSVARQRLVLFADSAGFADDASAAALGGIRFHRNAAVETEDTIQSMFAERQLQPASTTIASWDYKAKRVNAASLFTAHDYASPNAVAAESYDWSGVYAFADTSEAEHYASLLRDSTDARFKTWAGEGTVRTFRPGTAFKLAESPLDQWSALGFGEAQRRFALLDVQHAGINNLSADLRHQLRLRLGAAPAIGGTHAGDEADWEELFANADSSGYANRFTVIRADVVWRPALRDGTGALLNPRPVALGSQTAIVVGPDGSTADAGTVHTDYLGRIRIRYHWQQEESNTCWVRVAQIHAGPGYGAQFIPRIGQEVVVSFFDNDIDRPLVTGVLYNGQGQDDQQAHAMAGDHSPAGQDNKIGNGASPAWHGNADAHRHAAFLSGFKSVALGVDGYARQANQLVFDDTTGRLRTKLATDSAATQLNLGHLIHQADNYRGSFRGTGWELRTDAYGALRAGKGVLFSTYYGSTPDGQPEPSAENTPGIALMKQAKGFADTFTHAAAAHQTVQFILAKGGALNGEQKQSRLDDKQAPIAAMLDRISGRVNAEDGGTDGQGQQIPHMHAPLVVVTAQAGIGITAADGLHIAAEEAAHLSSGRDMHIGVGETLSMHSGQAIGVLSSAVSAGEGDVGEGDVGIKLYAGEGDVEFQAQSDEMYFIAKELVRLISVHGPVDFGAAKRVTLCTEGGASLSMQGGNIVFTCPGTISMKATAKHFTGPTSINYRPIQFPRSVLKRSKDYPLSR